MLEFCITIAKGRDFIKGIAGSPGKIFHMVRLNVKEV